MDLLLQTPSDRPTAWVEALSDLGVPVRWGPWQVIQPATEHSFLLVVEEASAETWACLRDPLQTSGRMLAFAPDPPADADDWVVPCSLDDVAASVRAASTLDLGDGTLDVLSERLGSESVTPVEAALLHRLWWARGQPVRREVLYREVWGYRGSVRSRALDTAVRRVRSKLAAAGLTAQIQTVRGLGYGLKLGEASPEPARSPSAEPSRPSLPEPASRVFGRDEDEALLRTLLDQASIVTLTGPGGVGKTTLAMRLQSEDPRWVWVDGAPADTVDELAEIVSGALGVPPERLESALELRDETLLILDNLDQIAAVAAGTVARWAGHPGVRILATSRETLRVRAEVVHRLQPLPVPALHADLETLRAAPAVQVVLDVASAAGHRTEAPGEIQAAALIARSVDGLPLALQIAASRASLATLQEISRHLDGGLAELPNPLRDAPDRHASLAVALSTTWTRLPEPARQALVQAALSPVALPFQAVCAMVDVPGHPTDALLATLVHASVLHRREDAHLQVLAPVREWLARHRPVEAEAVLGRYLQWFGDHYNTPSWLFGPDSARLPGVLLRQLPLVRLALARTRTHPLQAVAVVTAVLGRLGRYSESLALLGPALERLPPGPEWAGLQASHLHAVLNTQGGSQACAMYRRLEPAIRAHASSNALARFYANAVFALDQRDPAEQLAAGQRAVEAARAAPSLLARALAALATAHLRHGEHDLALDCISQALEVSHDDPASRSMVLNTRGAILLEAGRLELAERALRRAIESLDALDDLALGANCRSNLAGVCFQTGRIDEAMALVTEELGLHRRMGNEGRAGVARGYLGLCHAASGRPKQAIPELSAGIRAAVARGEVLIERSFRTFRAQAYRATGDDDLAEVDERRLAASP